MNKVLAGLLGIALLGITAGARVRLTPGRHQRFHPQATHPGIPGHHKDATDLAFDPAAFDHSRVLQESESTPVYLYWSVDDTKIHVGLDVHGSTGWFAMALAVNGGMVGADMWVLREEAGDGWVLEDRFSEDWATPALDALNDLALGEVARVGNRTSFTFSRLLDPCDGGAATGLDPEYTKRDVSIRPNQLMDLLWARGSWMSFDYHGTSPAMRGNVESHAWIAPIFGGEPFTEEERAEFTTVTAINGEFSLPNKTTTYVDSYFELPPGTHVLVDLKSVDGLSSEFIHHTLLYGCQTKLTPSPPQEGRLDDGACAEILIMASELMPKGMKGGIIVGDGTLVQSLRVEIHYENLQNVPGLVDPGTGYEVLLAQDKGDFVEIGTLTTGTRAIAVPPHTKKTSLAEASVWGECVVPDDGSLPDEGLTIMYSAFHMHLDGRAMHASIIRDGKEILLARTNYYDWNYQRAVGSYVEQGTKVLPGDRLVIKCTYSTMSELNAAKHGGVGDHEEYVTYGDGTLEEMCFDFLLYYPRVPGIAICLDQAGLGVYPTGDATRTRPEWTEKQAPNTLVESASCPGWLARPCEKAKPCFSGTGCLDNGSTNWVGQYSECAPAAGSCAPCFPYSPCCEGSDCEEPIVKSDADILSSELVRSPACPLAVEEGGCKGASYCFMHGPECDGGTGAVKWFEPDAICEGAATCGPCFPNSKCAEVFVQPYEALVEEPCKEEGPRVYKDNAASRVSSCQLVLPLVSIALLALF